MHTCTAAAAALLLAGCFGNGDDEDLPQLSPATGATLAQCEALAGSFSFTNTEITSAATVPAGTLTVGGTPVAEHCLVTGKMNERVSAVDGQTYAIGFEVRLPTDWNGRFFYQANGGIDGNIVPALGTSGGGPLTGALAKGFAVISSDAGHNAAQNPLFGLDPQARLDYGYQAVGTLTPMAKNLIAAAYGKGPDRSYIGGCSNGGRHTFVATARYADQYDGFLAGAPGYRLPLAAIANIFGAQRYSTVATDPADLSTAFTTPERAMLSAAVLAKCDALDGATDGLIQDTTACQAAFNLDRDVPTCTGARDGTCLTADQKSVVGSIFSGATTTAGDPFYSSFPYDSGHAGSDVPFWEFIAPLVLDSAGVGFIWGVPPQDPATFNGPVFALTTPVDDMLSLVNATDATYTESALSFMMPPNPSDLSLLKNRGAKVMVYHGVSDSIFSADDTKSWYEALADSNGGDASNFARFYRVPGMNHCSGGPSTDQFDMLDSLVQWVEHGQAPSAIVASARGAGNVGGVNPDVPADWAPNRTRPLCPYPQVARYKGSGDKESADSFECK